MNYKKLAAVFTLVVVAAVGVIILLSYNPAVASEKSHPPEADVPILDSTQESSNTVSPQEQLAILSQKATALSSQPGWVFVRSTIHYDTDRPNNGVLPNGQEIPLAQVFECWYHVNEDGLVFESVTTMFTLDGKIVQESVFANGVLWGSALDETSTQTPYFLTNMDGGFGNLARDFTAKTGQEPEVSVTELDGRIVYTFTVFEVHEGGMIFVDFDKPVAKTIKIASFDAETGFILQEEVISAFTDGTERTFSQANHEILINVVPPESISKILDQRR